MIAPVFLSASEPNPKRSKEYWTSRRLLNVREAVRAFCGHALAHFPVVFGGHPAITPLVKNVADRLAHDVGLRKTDKEYSISVPKILMFQSRLFVDRKATDDEFFTEPRDMEGAVTKPLTGWRNESLLFMRYEMIGQPTSVPIHPLLKSNAPELGAARKNKFGTYKFSAAVFIGGMEGVEREFNIFRTFHPDTPAYPIISTGSACIKLLEEVKNRLDPRIYETLQSETAYSLLMQQILPVSSIGVDTKSAGWREGPPSQIDPKSHIDPEKINFSLSQSGSVTPPKSL